MKRQASPKVMRQVGKSLQLALTVTESASWPCEKDIKEECESQARICKWNPRGFVWVSGWDREQWFFYVFVVLFICLWKQKFCLWTDCIPALKLPDGKGNLPLQRCSCWGQYWTWSGNGFLPPGGGFPGHDTVAFMDRTSLSLKGKMPAHLRVGLSQ